MAAPTPSPNLADRAESTEASTGATTGETARLSEPALLSRSEPSVHIAPARAEERLPASVLIAYSLPRAGIGLVGVVVATYLAKFATDVLLIAPAAMAVIHAASRIWDGFTDPLAGFASDRTRSRRGRRRSWMLASALPLMGSVILLWAPPTGLEGLVLVGWMAAAYLLYETAQTAFLIPHGALGVELSQDYHERTRVFGWQHVGLTMGTLGGLWFLHALTTSEDPRGLAASFGVIGGAALAAAVIFAALRLPERREYQGRGSLRLRKSFADVFRNPHARLLLFVYGIESLGAASVLALLPYVSQYILDDPSYFTQILFAYLVPQALLTPLWLRLTRSLDKKKLWMTSMFATSLCFVVQFFYSPQTPSAVILGVAFVLGVSAAIGAVCALSIKADIIDYDEYLTHERKEGAYLAVWNLVRKVASALPPFLALWLMGWFGYVANAPQNDATQLVMRTFFGLFPAVCYLIGTTFFIRFRFNQREHAEIREVLRQRPIASGGDPS